jgi:hypothetical protein
MRGSTVVGSLQFCLLLLCFGFQVTEAVEKYDHGSIKDCAEIAPDGMVNEAVETYNHNSERDCAEITAHVMVSVVATM